MLLQLSECNAIRTQPKNNKGIWENQQTRSVKVKVKQKPQILCSMCFHDGACFSETPELGDAASFNVTGDYPSAQCAINTRSAASPSSPCQTVPECGKKLAVNCGEQTADFLAHNVWMLFFRIDIMQGRMLCCFFEKKVKT